MTDRDTSARFGLRVGGVDLLTPDRVAAEFLGAATIYPMPLAPRRLRGFLQLRGHPVPVLDATPDPPERQPVLSRRAALVIEGFGDTFALLVDAAPHAVALTGPAKDQQPVGVLAPVLREPLVDALDGRVWWQADYERLARILTGDR
jgi:hypothetical protein